MTEKIENPKKFISLSQRQKNLLKGKVKGLKLRDIADSQGYKSVHAVSRLAQSPIGQAEMAKLQEESNAIFLKEMAELTKAAIDTLLEVMSRQDLEDRTALDAARFVLKELSLPLLQNNKLPTAVLEPLDVPFDTVQ